MQNKLKTNYNYMEKYIIIFVILATIYYIQTKLKDTEGFESVPAQSIGGVDDTNAINTLAQISKQLMTGGVTVPGNMSVQGDMALKGGLNTGGPVNFNNAGANFIQINKGVVVDKNSVQLWNNNDGSLIIVGRKDDNADYNWPGIVLNGKTSTITATNLTNTNLTTTNLTTTNLTATNLTATNLILGGLQRKYMAGGYYHIRGHGGHVPLYNGWNFFWQDHNWTEGFRKKIKWNGSTSQSYIHYAFGNHMLQASDQNWVPRILAVMPGYKAKMYIFLGAQDMGPSPNQSQITFGPGEYDWTDKVYTDVRPVHIIALALEGEDLPPDKVSGGYGA